jgi:hypothetical protein
MNASSAIRRNNLNSSLQEGHLTTSSPVAARAPSAQGATLERRRRANLALEATEAARAVEQSRKEQLLRFGEACEVTLNEDRETEALFKAETVAREVAAGRLLMGEERSERLRRRDAALEETTSWTPVMDMHFCIDNLDAIKSKAGDFSLKDERLLGLLGFRPQEVHSQRAEHICAKSLGEWE